MNEGTHIYRDASHRLTLSVDPDYPTRPVNIDEVRHTLRTQFGAEFGVKWESPLGDAMTHKFTIDGEAFELDWDNWLGLVIIAVHPSGEPIIQRIADCFTSTRISESAWRRAFRRLMTRWR